VPQFTTWKSLGSDHIIADTPATGFQYRYAVDEEFDYYSLANQGLNTTDRWSVTIAAPDGTIIFKQDVVLKYSLVYMGAGPMLIIFVWYISSETITTTVPENPPTLASESGYAIPAGGSDFTALAGHIMFDWYSPVYEIALPVGAIFDVTFHTAGAPALRQSEAAVQTRVFAGGGMTGTRMTEDGMVRLVRPRSGGGLEFISGCDVRGLGAVGGASWSFSVSDAPSEPQVSSLISARAAATHGIAFYLHQVAPVVIYQESGNLMAVRSSDDGRTWDEAMEIVNGVTMTAAAIGPDGGTISIVGMRGTAPVALVCSFERTAEGVATIRATDEFAAVGLPSLPLSLQFMQIQNNVYHLIIDNSGCLRYYRSSDGMRSWQ